MPLDYLLDRTRTISEVVGNRRKCENDLKLSYNRRKNSENFRKSSEIFAKSSGNYLKLRN